jgi:hypothetical protein
MLRPSIRGAVTRAVTLAMLVQGCAALPIAALGGAMLESSAGAIVKTGTEYTMSGAAHRTLTVPVNAVRAAVLEAFDRTGVVVQPDDASGKDDRIVGTLQNRTVHVRLTAFSAALTGMTLIVKRNVLLKDRATSNELLEQIEQVLSENPTFARRLHRSPTDEVAASPRWR